CDDHPGRQRRDAAHLHGARPGGTARDPAHGARSRSAAARSDACRPPAREVTVSFVPQDFHNRRKHMSTTSTATTSPNTYARIAALLYLTIIAAGIAAQFFVRGSLIVPGDAAATA